MGRACPTAAPAPAAAQPTDGISTARPRALLPALGVMSDMKSAYATNQGGGKGGKRTPPKKRVRKKSINSPAKKELVKSGVGEKKALELKFCLNYRTNSLGRASTTVDHSTVTA